MTSNKEIQRILEIKENGDEIIQHLTHSLEIYGRWESQTNTSTSTSEKTGGIQRQVDFANDLKQTDTERLRDRGGR
jgi:hypothetical protein